MIITLDPEGDEASPGILRCVTEQHKQCAGVYGTVLTPGEVRTGDPVGSRPESGDRVALAF